MGLVFLRHNQEQGQLLDYEIDLAYGSDENDYVLETSEPKMALGDMWVVEGTEFGGIVDSIDGKSDVSLLKYSGRSLQGILAGYNAVQILKSTIFFVLDNTIQVAGTVSDIMEELKNQLGFPFAVDGVDVEINEEADRFQDLYSFLKAIFEKNTLKLKFGYTKEDGFTLSVVDAIDFSKKQAVDLTAVTTSLTIGNYVPNHYIGINRQDDRVYIKHFFANQKGEFDGFFQLDENHKTPLYDEEYERFDSEKVVFGKDEIVEVVEDSSVVQNYDLVTEKKTVDGVEQGNTVFRRGVPFDWATNYTNYFYKAYGTEEFLNFEAEEDFRPYTPGSNWASVWQNYFKKVNGEYVQLGESDCVVTEGDYYPVDFSTEFQDSKLWSKLFVNYYTRQRVDNEWQYFPVEGEPSYRYSKQAKKPSDWDERKGSYFIQWQRPCWDVYAERKQNGKWVKIGETQRIVDSLKNGSPDGKKTFAYYFSSNSTKKQRKTVNGTRWTVSPKQTVFNKKVTVEYYAQELKLQLDKIKFESGKFFLRVEVGKKAPPMEDGVYFGKYPNSVASYPTGGTYYEKGDFIPAPYIQGNVYKIVEDHYAGMVEKIQEKNAEYLEKTQSLKADFSPEFGEYDCGDVIAGRHPLTNEFLFCKISKKIVKIDPYKTEISYDVY